MSYLSYCSPVDYRKQTISDEQFVRNYLQHIVLEICREKEMVFNTVPSSRAIIRRRDQVVSTDLLNQLRKRTEEFESLCLVQVEGNDTNDTAQF